MRIKREFGRGLIKNNSMKILRAGRNSVKRWVHTLKTNPPRHVTQEQIQSSKEALIRYDRAIKAFVKSAQKRGVREAEERHKAGEQIKWARAHDSKKSWGVSFHAGVADLSTKYYQLDLVKEIREHKRMWGGNNYTVLEVGCGIGKAASELKKYLGKEVRIIATGVKKIPEWGSYENSREIEWRITHTKKLAQTIPAESVDFIHSNLGLTHAHNTIQAIKEAAKLLRKKGRMIITSERLIKIGQEIGLPIKIAQEIPELKMISTSTHFIETNGGSSTQLLVYYLEKK